MRVGIIGGGTVGRATARVWLEHAEEVCVWDVLRERSTAPSCEYALSCDLVFLCLPEDCVGNFVGDHCAGRPINLVLKSTVPIGTTRALIQNYDVPNLVHNPEFLTERCAAVDAQMPACQVLGIPDWNKHAESENRAYSLLYVCYRKRFPGIKFICLSSDGSEAVKLFVNAFCAVKVSFFNEVYRLAETLGLDWEAVRAGMLAQGRIAHSHTQVPGPDGKFGFGGKCLPKDLLTLIGHLEQAGMAHGADYVSVCRATEMANYRYRDGDE